MATIPSPPPQFTAEGGKSYLAKALFNAFRFRIRCLQCAGTPNPKGFIKDLRGKGAKDRQSRRL